VEPLIHFMIPFAALTLYGLDLRKALPLSLLALLPDFDALFFVHRSFSHSIIVVVGFMAPILVLAYRFRPRLYSYAVMALLVLASHLVLDVFAGYTPILWPLYGYSIWIQAGLTVHMGSSPSLALRVELPTKPTTFQPFRGLDAPLFTGEGLILSIMLLIPVLLKAHCK